MYSQFRIRSLICSLCFLIVGSTKADPPVWDVNPADYQYNMVGIIRVLKLNNTFLNEDETMIRAMVNGETRGVVESMDIIFIGNEAYMPITMYSNQQVGEELSFEIYVSSTDSIYAASETAVYNRNENLGDPTEPFLLTIGICDNVLILDEDDLPFRSFYKAGQRIRIEGVINTMPDLLVLDAPIVQLEDAVLLDSNKSLIARGVGCID